MLPGGAIPTWEWINEIFNRIVIGKTIYELGIHSQDGSSYNVTYAPWQQNTLDSHLARENDASREGQLVAPF